MPRLRNAALFFFDSYPLSACNLSGRLRGRPRGRLMGLIASTVASSIVVSLTLAAVKRIASGMPSRSTTRCRFVPCLPRSVGFFPVFSPPRETRLRRRRSKLGSSRCDRPVQVDPAGTGGGDPRLPLSASREDVASMSCHCHSPFPWAASPRGCRYAGRRECPSKRPDLTPEAVLPSALASLEVTRRRSTPIACRQQVDAYRAQR